MTDEELIARLRDAPADGLGTENLCIAAADRIEALVKERDEAINQLDSARHSVDVLEKRVAHFMSRAEQMEAALRKIGKTYPADNMRLIHGELHILNIVNAALKGADHV